MILSFTLETLSTLLSITQRGHQQQTASEPKAPTNRTANSPTVIMLSDGFKLFLAVFSNNMDNLRALPQRNQELDDSDIIRGLVQALQGSFDVVEHRLEAFCLLYERLSPTSKLLHAAATCNATSFAPNATSFAPLRMAVMNRRTAIVEWLAAETNCNVNQADSSMHSMDTPLLCAASDDHDLAEIAKILLDHGADQNLVNGLGHSPLNMAIINDNPGVVRVLLQHGATVSEHDIQTAYESAQFAVTTALLLEYNTVAPHPMQTFMQTALKPVLLGTNVTRPHKVHLCRVLGQYTKTSLSASLALQSLLHDLLTQAAPGVLGNTEAVSILLEAGVAAHSLDELILLAIETKQLGVCLLLIHEYAVNPLIPANGFVGGNYQLTPFNAAAAQHGGDMDIFKEFLSFCNHQSIFVTNHGDFPMHILVRDKKVSVQAIEVAVEQRPLDLEAVNDHGNTPLHVAAMSGVGHSLIDTLLGAHAAALEVVNNMGLTPVHVAATSDAGIDIVYTLLRQNPLALWLLRRPTTNNAIIQPGLATTAAAAAAIDVGIPDTLGQVREAAVIDMQAQNESLQAENERLRAEASLKDADNVEKDEELERLRAEIQSLRAQLKAGNDAEIEDAKKATSRTNADDDDDGSSGLRNSSVVVVVDAVVVDRKSAAAADADNDDDDNGVTTAPPPSKKTKTGH